MFVERNVKKFIGESDVSRTTHQGRYGRWGNRLSCYGDDVTLWLGILARTSHSSQYYHTARLLYAKNIRVAAIHVHCWAYCYTNPLVAVLVEAIALMEQCGPARSLRLQPPYLIQLQPTTAAANHHPCTAPRSAALSYGSHRGDAAPRHLCFLITGLQLQHAGQRLAPARAFYGQGARGTGDAKEHKLPFT
jgi:hypothetical protein